MCDYVCACVCNVYGRWFLDIDLQTQTRDCDLTFLFCQFDSGSTDLLSVCTKRQHEAGPPSCTHHSLLEALCLFTIHSPFFPKPKALLGRLCDTSQPKPWDTRANQKAEQERVVNRIELVLLHQQSLKHFRSEQISALFLQMQDVFLNYAIVSSFVIKRHWRVEDGLIKRFLALLRTPFTFCLHSVWLLSLA